MEDVTDRLREGGEQPKRLVVRGVNKYFGETRALSDIALEVGEGEFCVLLGPSGCGKSTLLRIIAGLETPSTGKIFIDGKDVTDLHPGKRDISMVFQTYAIYPHMTVFENMAFPLSLRKLPKMEIRQRVNEVASLLRVNELLDRKPAQLSGGERQRVAMGRAIVRKPKLFLFDEPLSNLDAKLRADMRVEIMSLHQKLRATTLYVTHDQIEAMTMADTLVVLNEGIVQQIDRPQTVYRYPANLMVAEFIGDPPMNLIAGILSRSAATGAAASFNSQSLSFSIPHCGLEGEAVIGIRPEHALIDPNGKWVGKVEFVENTGSDKFVHVVLTAGEKIVVRASDRQQVRIGQWVRLSIDQTRLSLFWQGVRTCHDQPFDTESLCFS